MFPIYEAANFKTKFNQVEHEFEIYLDSGFGENEQNRYPINPNSIVNLLIEDTLADWIVRGSLTIFYNPESGPGTTNPYTGSDITAQTGIVLPNGKFFYPFRNDGFDLLRIRIKPLLENNQNLPNSTVITNPVHWSLSYLFSIYDVEDIDLPPGAQNQASSSIKCLKMYFWDAWYQKMLTNRIEYSTGLSPRTNANLDIQQGIYSNPGVLSTGQAIKEVINIGLSENSDQDGYNDTTIIDPILKANYEPVNNEKWEDGAGKIFFTAPTGDTAFESLMYLYNNHISSDSFSLGPKKNFPRGGAPDTKLYDFSILMKDRGPSETDVGQFTLQSVSSYFQNAGSTQKGPGPYQYEHFFLQSYTDFGKTKPTKFLRGPISDSQSDVVDFKSLKYGTISNYRFVDISALTNTTEFASSPVYSFDFKNRTFNCEFQNNSVLTAREFMSEKYIKNVYKKNNVDLEKLFLIAIEKNKTNKNVIPEYSLFGDNDVLRQKPGFHKLLYYGLFHNTAINFRTLGLSFREPGRFIAIDKTEGVDEGDFEDKFFGQWFVINVKHIFESEIYYNDITAVKIHRFDKMSLNFPGTI